MAYCSKLDFYFLTLTHLYMMYIAEIQIKLFIEQTTIKQAGGFRKPRSSPNPNIQMNKLKSDGNVWNMFHLTYSTFQKLSGSSV